MAPFDYPACWSSSTCPDVLRNAPTGRPHQPLGSNQRRDPVEFVGYITRGVAHSNTGKLMPFVIQNTFLLLPPVLFAATVYMVLGRIIRSVKDEQYSLLRVDWLTRAFVLGDVLSFTVQGGAAGLMATGDNVDLGEKIVVAGLLIQVVVFGFFCITAAVFHYWYQIHGVGEVAYGE